MGWKRAEELENRGLSCRLDKCDLFQAIPGSRPSNKPSANGHKCEITGDEHRESFWYGRNSRLGILVGAAPSGRTQQAKTNSGQSESGKIGSYGHRLAINLQKPSGGFRGGYLHQSRHYSQFISSQIKARMEGISTPVYGMAKYTTALTAGKCSWSKNVNVKELLYS